MTHRLEILIGLLLIAPAGACERSPRVPAAPGATRGGSSIAHWDPVARRFIEPPPGVVGSLVGAAPAAPLPPLLEEDAPRGGKMVRLGARFQNHLSASIDRAEQVTSACSTESRVPEGR
jgi:hypothetical protein